MIATSAPGKIVLSGEYAVLAGAPAICTAVSRRARVAITESPGERHRVVAPGYSDVEGRFTTASGYVRWQQGGEEYPLVNAVWRLMQPVVASSLTLMLDTSEFREATSGAKTGIGSSAALTVALVAALANVSTSKHDVAATASDAHREFQRGTGSGIDIACSIAGGLIEYRMQDRYVAAVDWPRGLHHALLWSGIPVSTGTQLQRWQQASAKPSLDALLDASRSVAASWREGDAAALLEQYHNYGDALAAFGDDHGLGIYAAGHAELAAAARQQGLFYKPCGAGGGDVGIVLGMDANAVAGFAAEARDFGFRQLDVALQAPGARQD